MPQPGTHSAPPEPAHLRELEDENRRLLALVGELLLTNQRLREQLAPGRTPQSR